MIAPRKSDNPESIRLFNAFLEARGDLAEARLAVREAEKTGDCTVEMKDAVVVAERAAKEAQQAHDAVSDIKAAEIIRSAK